MIWGNSTPHVTYAICFQSAQEVFCIIKCDWIIWLRCTLFLELEEEYLICRGGKKEGGVGNGDRSGRYNDGDAIVKIGFSMLGMMQCCD